MVVVAASGATFRAALEAVVAEGGRVLRVEAAEAAETIPQLDPDGVVLCTGAELTGTLATVTNAPLIVLGLSSKLGLPETSKQAVRAFARALAKGPGAPRPFRAPKSEAPSPESPLEGVRVLAIGAGASRMDRLANALRDRGAQVVVADVDGTGLAEARAIDPQIALVAGTREEVAPRVRRDRLLRWAFPIRFDWHVLEEDEGAISVERLGERIRPLLELEQAIRRQVLARNQVDTTLDLVGPARLLRLLGRVELPLSISVRTISGRGEIDLSSGLVLNARWWQEGRARPRFTGASAIAAMICLDEAWVRITRRDRPMPAGLVLSVDEALTEARVLLEPVADELPTVPRIAPWSQRPPDAPSITGSPGSVPLKSVPSAPAVPELPPPPMIPEDLASWEDAAAEPPTHSGVQPSRHVGEADADEQTAIPPATIPPATIPPATIPPAGMPSSAAAFLPAPPATVGSEVPPEKPRERSTSGRKLAIGGLAAGLVAIAAGLGLYAYGTYRPRGWSLMPSETRASNGFELTEESGGGAAEVGAPASVGNGAENGNGAGALAAGDPAGIVDVDPVGELEMLSGAAPEALRAWGGELRMDDPIAARRRSDAMREVAAEHREAGRVREAEATLQHAFLLAPSNPHVCRDLAELYLHSGDPSLALPWARRAAVLRRRQGSYRVLVGDVLQALGQSRAARAEWREALRIEPGLRAARQRLR